MNPTEPPTRPDSPQSIPPMRKSATSSSDWVEAATGSHSFSSTPPGVRRVYELVGYYIFWLVRETWLHKRLLAHWVALTFGATALSHHLWHWIPR